MNSHQRRTWRRYLLRHPDVARAIEHKRIMRTYRHAFVMLEPTRARWSPWHALMSWWHLRTPRPEIGRRAVALLLLASILPGLHAEPRNAPDVKGKFTLIVAGTKYSDYTPGVCSPATCDHWFHGRQDRIEPFQIPGFDSFYRCRAAGMELQARFNTDGYTLDFVCALTGK